MKRNRPFPHALPGLAPTLAVPLVLAVALGAALLAPTPARADRDDDHDRNRNRDHDHDRARTALRRGEALPLAEILNRIQSQVPGRFLEVELEDEHGALVYEVKIMDDRGRITRLDVDAATGKILERRVGGHH